MTWLCRRKIYMVFTSCIDISKVDRTVELFNTNILIPNFVLQVSAAEKNHLGEISEVP